jgi:uncharacterized protein YndB with AHSA1/START domain
MDKTFSAQTSIVINAPTDKVWDALVNPTMVKQYLHDTDMTADWVEGGSVTWSGEWNGKAYQDKGTVLKFEPKKIISTTHWSPLSGTEDKPKNYHIVTYELSESHNQTILTLIQGNSPTQEDADNMIENGWKPIIQSIKKLVEG